MQSNSNEQSKKEQTNEMLPEENPNAKTQSNEQIHFFYLCSGDIRQKLHDSVEKYCKELNAMVTCFNNEIDKVNHDIVTDGVWDPIKSKILMENWMEVCVPST